MESQHAGCNSEQPLVACFEKKNTKEHNCRLISKNMYRYYSHVVPAVSGEKGSACKPKH